MPQPLLKLKQQAHETHITHLPHLPRLTWDQCRKVFAKSGIGPSALSALTGISRRSLWLWNRPKEDGGRDPTALNLDVVSTLAYACLRAMRGRTLPLAGKASAEELAAAIENPNNALPPLDQCTARQLLPESWITE